jgi:hypothetical protein
MSCASTTWNRQKSDRVPSPRRGEGTERGVAGRAVAAVDVNSYSTVSVKFFPSQPLT